MARLPWLEAFVRLVVETVRVCLRYRVTGLAAEAGFFMLLSVPPLLLGLFGGVGYVGNWLGRNIVDQVREEIQAWASRFLTDNIIASTIAPTVDDVFRDGRFDLISLGFLLSLWSGSRALNVFIDTISIMYGQSGVRGIVRTRALSFSMYAGSLVVGIITIPLFLIGPTLLGQILPTGGWQVLTSLYWPFVSLVTVFSLTSLYHVATPVRSPWLRDVPGAVLTLVIWVLAAYVVRSFIAASLGGTSIYGPLSAPIILLIFLYFLAIAVLIGAAFNAAVRNVWPTEETRSLRARAWARAKEMRGSSDEESVNERAEDTLGISGVKEASRGPLTALRPGADRDRSERRTAEPVEERTAAAATTSEPEEHARAKR